MSAPGSSGTSEDLYLTQLVWVHPGKEAVFLEFEDMAIPLIAEHGGELVLRVRPDKGSVIAAAIETPYEIHVVRFKDEQCFLAFMQDEVRQRFLALKENSVRATLLVRGRLA